MESLKNIKDTKKKYGLRNLATITYETLQYLEESPCKMQSHESIRSFLNEVRPYKITANECLMMANDPPASALHIQLVIAPCRSRLRPCIIDQPISQQQWNHKFPSLINSLATRRTFHKQIIKIGTRFELLANNWPRLCPNSLYRYYVFEHFTAEQLVEDNEERLTEEQVNEILEIIKKHFPEAPSELS